jgi:DNA-directed RNA polymerase subunit RPC12/RpoP
MKVDPKRHCPHCGSAEVFRSHRRDAVERYLLRAIGMRPFRCVNCDARFYRLKHSDGPASSDLTAAERTSSVSRKKSDHAQC